MRTPFTITLVIATTTLTACTGMADRSDAYSKGSTATDGSGAIASIRKISSANIIQNNGSYLPLRKVAKLPSALDTDTDVVAGRSPALALWTIDPSDKTVRQALVRWSKIAEYSVIWDVQRDISIDSQASFEGSFESAVKSVFESLETSDYPIQAIVYSNKVVRIVKTAKVKS